MAVSKSKPFSLTRHDIVVGIVVVVSAGVTVGCVLRLYLRVIEVEGLLFKRPTLPDDQRQHSGMIQQNSTATQQHTYNTYNNITVNILA